MPRSRSARDTPNLEVIVGNESAPESRSEAFLHDADRKPSLRGPKSPLYGLGKTIAESVRQEIENWQDGMTIRSNVDLAREFGNGSKKDANKAMWRLLSYHFRNDPFVWQFRQQILRSQQGQNLIDLPDHVRSANGRKGYDASLANYSAEERRATGYRALAVLQNKKHLQGLHFGSAQEFALGQLLKVHVPGFRIDADNTYQVGIGEKRIDFLVPYRELAVFVEWHPIRMRDPECQMSDFPSRAMYKQFQRSLRRTKEGRNGVYRLWRTKLLDLYAAERRALVDSSAYEGTPLVVGQRPLQVLPLFSHLDLATPNPRSFARDFKELENDYRKLGIRELNKRYSL